MMSITDSDRLAYDAPTLEVTINGEKHRYPLHYGYGGLRRIEKHFGSLQGLTDKLSKGADGEFFDAVFIGLLCGLWQTGITEEQLEAGIEPSDIEKHGLTLSEALMQAFPQQAQPVSAPSNEPSATAPSESTGPVNITSLPSSVAGLTTASGA